MNMTQKIRICFVCHGNICRSPTAEAVMNRLLEKDGLTDRFQIESAAVSAVHEGEQPDPRTVLAGEARGLRFATRAVMFRAEDFARFDHVLVMDESNKTALHRRARTDEDRAKIRMLVNLHPGPDAPTEVPDPYYGGSRGFDDVIDICEATCRALLTSLR